MTPTTNPITQVLGLDLSLNHTGWCLCSTATPAQLVFGVHNFQNRPLGDVEKMDRILHWLEPLLLPGVLVVIENLAFRAQGRAVLQLAGLHYLVRHLLLRHGTRFLLIAPAQAKKFLTGKHNCSKDLVLKEVFKRYGIDTDDHNIADAINLNQIAQALLGLTAPAHHAQRTVIAELIRP